MLEIDLHTLGALSLERYVQC